MKLITVKVLTMKLLMVKKATQNLLSIMCLLALVSCAIPNEKVLGQAGSEWDFDHNVQFKKTKYDDNNYQLEVIPNNNVSFERLSAFLLRRSYLICGTYGFKLRLIKGIEGFDFLKQSPNLIMPNLTAKLECPMPNA